jgi:two-component system, cell cycle response regulator DivK
MSKRILVVEDQADNRQIIRDMLAPTDYEITEVEDGEQALAAIAKQRPDLILLDIQLPVMDGYTATSRIKADPALRSIPIIAVTSYVLSGAKKRRRARRAVMTMCRNLSVHANCWRRFVNTCNNRIKRTSDCGPRPKM